ncbi:MAG: zinc transporter ZntB [Desulfofustis sp.]|nr:zinc transporter ZntB [Desulfofustis sp.]
MTIEHPIQAIRLTRAGGEIGIENGLLTEAIESDELCWIHLDYSHPAVREWLDELASLDSIIKSNLTDDDTRPRSFTHQNGIFLSLRGVNLNPGSDPEDMIAVRLWADERCIITSNRRRLLSLDDIRAGLLGGRGPNSAGGFISLLVELLAVRAETVIEQLEEQLDLLEDDLNKGDGDIEPRIPLSDLRRQAIRLRRFFSPQRQALEHLLNDHPRWLGKGDLLLLRESLNQFNRYIEELDAVRDMAVVAQEELLGKLSEVLNKRMYTLSLVATIFLPLGFLTGLLGINVGGIPGANSPYGFLLICLGIGAIVFCLIALLKIKKWF